MSTNLILNESIETLLTLKGPFDEPFQLTQSLITQETVPSCRIPDTFRFPVFLEILPMPNGTHALIGVIPKSRRVHNHTYNGLLEELSFRDNEQAIQLKEWVTKQVQNGVFQLIEPETIENETKTTTTIQPFKQENNAQLLVDLITAVFSKLYQQNEEQTNHLLSLNEPSIPDIVVTDQLINESFTENELTQLIDAANLELTGQTEKAYHIQSDDDIRRIIRFIPTVLSERWNQIKFELELERKRNGFVGTDENYVLDKITGDIVICKYGGHHSAVIQLINKNHSHHFRQLTEEEQTEFYLNTFYLHGSYYPQTFKSYIPTTEDIWD